MLWAQSTCPYNLLKYLWSVLHYSRISFINCGTLNIATKLACDRENYFQKKKTKHEFKIQYVDQQWFWSWTYLGVTIFSEHYQTLNNSCNLLTNSFNQFQIRTLPCSRQIFQCSYKVTIFRNFHAFEIMHAVLVMPREKHLIAEQFITAAITFNGTGTRWPNFSVCINIRKEHSTV